MSTRIPINHGKILDSDRSFVNIQTDMDNRRKEWENEIEKMRNDFFTMNSSVAGHNDPHAKMTSGLYAPKNSVSSEDGKAIIEIGPDGTPCYKASFDLRDYKPEAVNVKTDDSKFIVSAKQQSKEGPSLITREYLKEMDLPPEINPQTLKCSMSGEGVLVIEAKMPTPSYKNIPPSIPIRHPVITHGSDTTNVDKSLFTRPENPGLHERPGLVSAGSAFNRPTTTARSEPTLKTIHTTQTPVATGPDLQAKVPDMRKSPITVDKSRQMYSIEVDIEDFKPEDLNVKTVDGKLVVSATKEDKTGPKTCSKQMSREFTLPGDVDPTSVKAFFTDNGKLVVEAPYRA